jgi:hypothetical protein
MSCPCVALPCHVIVLPYSLVVEVSNSLVDPDKTVAEVIPPLMVEKVIEEVIASLVENVFEEVNTSLMVKKVIEEVIVSLVENVNVEATHVEPQPLNVEPVEPSRLDLKVKVQFWNADMLLDRGRKPKSGRKQKLYIIVTDHGICKVGVTILTHVELLKRYVVNYGKIKIRLFPMKLDNADDEQRYQLGRNLHETYFKELVSFLSSQSFNLLTLICCQISSLVREFTLILQPVSSFMFMSKIDKLRTVWVFKHTCINYVM